MTDSTAPALTALALVEQRPPTLGAGRLLCIDGRAGSGKTTLAAQVAALRPRAVVLATDEMLHGWRGLPGLGASLEQLVRPLSRGVPGTWLRWDWVAGAWAGRRRVDPVDLLVLEGVGSAAEEIEQWITARIWVEAPEDLRHERWLDRDGPESERYWAAWATDESSHHQRHRTRDRADLVIDTGRQPPATFGPDDVSGPGAASQRRP